MKNIVRYESDNPDVSRIAFKSFSRHLWYLSEGLLAFGFFDDRIDCHEKIKMVKALSKPTVPEYPKRIEIKREEVLSTCISDFVTENTKKFMNDYKLDIEWLKIHPDRWTHHMGYQKSRNLIQQLHVVNDCAERAIKLVQEYNGSLTKDEKDLSALLQVVEQNIGIFPKNCRKTSAFTGKDKILPLKNIEKNVKTSMRGNSILPNKQVRKVAVFTLVSKGEVKNILLLLLRV